MRLWTRGAIVAAALAAAGSVALAQAQGIKRNILQREDVTGPEQKECVFGSAELPPGASIGKHIHHGFEIGYVAAGEGDLLVDGEPTRHLRAGDSYRVPARRPHDARNAGTSAFKVVATWVVEKGKPLAEPVR